MRIKIDENLPAEYAALLREAGFGADTVADDSVISEHCCAGGRVLVTLDLGFSDIRSYPPQDHLGIVVIRSKAQDKIKLISMLRRLLPVLREMSPEKRLWIVEADRIRFRED